MNYPVQITEIKNGLTFYIPDDAIIKETYELLKQKDPNTPFPYWAKIWASSIAMGAFLQKNPTWIQDKTVLEIGAGIGLPSFQNASTAKSIIISDYDRDAVVLMKKNIDFLKIKNVQGIHLDWNDFPNDIEGELVLLCDVNYAPSDFNALIKLIENLLNQNRILVLSTPDRISSSKFMEAINPYIKQSFLETVRENGQTINVVIAILKNN
jgi:predicted nicotinamide N-methyase